MAPKANKRSAVEKGENVPPILPLEVAAKISELLKAEGLQTAPPDLSQEADRQRVWNGAPDIMSRAEVASFLGVSVRSIQNFEARGLIRCIRIGRRRLYRKGALLAALERLES